MNGAAPAVAATPVPGEVRRRAHIAFAVTASVCVAAFWWMVSFGSFALIAEDTFGSFYDHQAAAWLEGRWDVPEPALSGEAFVVGGKVYGYFGPTPALLRVPTVAFGLGFAKVTRAWMLVDYVACLWGAYALLGLAARWAQPDGVPRPWSVVAFIVTVGLGSTLFFIGSRAYVYHEAILCGAAFALWSVYGALRFLQAPDSKWWVTAWALGMLAVHARAPIGLFALTVLGVVAARLVVTRGRGASEGAARRPLVIGLMSVLGVMSFNAISYVKFGTWEGCPLRYNVQYSTAQLDVLGHRNFHLSNLRFNTDAYLRRPIFSVAPRFPYIYREYINRREYPESRMAYRDPTLAIPWAMPALFVLALGSAMAAARTPPLRRPVIILWVSALPAALAMLTAIAVTQRYTADFVPFLIAAAAFGISAIATLPRAGRVAAVSTIAVLTALGVAVTLAITLHHQRDVVWGVPDAVKAEYVQWRQKADAWLTGTGRR